jgi:hypothetical protein
MAYAGAGKKEAAGFALRRALHLDAKLAERTRIRETLKELGG